MLRKKFIPLRPIIGLIILFGVSVSAKAKFQHARVCETLIRVDLVGIWPLHDLEVDGITNMALRYRIRKLVGDRIDEKTQTIHVENLDAEAKRFGACWPSFYRLALDGLDQFQMPNQANLSLKRLVGHIEDEVYYQLDEGIVIRPQAEAKIAWLAKEYRKRGGKTKLFITSGERSAHQQAEAMYIKMRLGARLKKLYRQQNAIVEVLQTYRDSRRHAHDRKETIHRIRQTIESQIKRGIFISQHLHGAAVDIRLRGLSRRDRRRLERLLYRYRKAIYSKKERKPPHYHLFFRDLDLPDAPYRESKVQSFDSTAQDQEI